MKRIIFSIIMTTILVLLAYKKKALTKAALLLSGICCLIICYIGGFPLFLMLALTFILSEIANHYHKKLKIKNDINEKIGKRDIVQIIANVLPCTIMIILFYITKKDYFIILYSISIAEALSDTLGSDVGIFSNQEPINILTLKKSPKGLSGNVTLLGLICEFLGPVLIGMIYYMTINNNLKILLLIIISGFLGAIIDSILGAGLQVKYQCKECKLITEKKLHCNKKTKYIKGIKWFNNDLVNLISNIASIIIGTILLLIIK